MDEQKTIYYVSRGDYSDYSICAFFSQEEDAQKYIDLRNKGTRYSDAFRLESAYIDRPEDFTLINRDTLYYRMSCSKEYDVGGEEHYDQNPEDVNVVTKYDPPWRPSVIEGSDYNKTLKESYERMFPTYNVVVQAHDYDEAVKLASALITQFKEEETECKSTS